MKFPVVGEIKWLEIGKCSCGKPAFSKHKKGISPGEWSAPVKMCESCLDSELLLDSAPKPA